MSGHKSTGKRTRNSQQGFTLVELMVAIAVLLVGVVAMAELVPAAVFLNGGNRANSSSPDIEYSRSTDCKTHRAAFCRTYAIISKNLRHNL